MLIAARTILRRLAAETRGAEIAEAAAVLPVMFMMILGIFWFGQAFSTYGTITRAAQEGARAAVAPLCTTCAGSIDPSANASSAVRNVLVAAHLDPTRLQQPITPPSLCACGSSVATCTGAGASECDNSQANICVQGVQHPTGSPLQENLIQLAPASTGHGVCGVSVSLRYPFKFWLPFTSLHKQQIWLQAQAEVRAETQ
jgi:Flp pilus assembly protein TadG